MLPILRSISVLQCIFFVVFNAMGIMMQEMTIPVGVDGRDTLTTVRVQDTLGNYDVGYNENQLTGGASFYREKGYANGTREGSYGYTTRNGLIRIVTYVADQDGYRAQVLTNEPGVGTLNPSNVTITKEKEPDPEALAQGPTGPVTSASDLQSSVMEASGTNVVRDYVVAASQPVEPHHSVYNQGHAQVMIWSPYGQYKYAI